MGAWGAGSFENDTALDWVGDLASGDADTLRDTLNDVVSEVGYLDSDLGSEGVAAAELVAAARGNGATDLPDEVNTWLRDHRAEIGPADVMLARRAVVRIKGSESELAELWAENEPDNEWLPVIDGLLARLA